MSFTWTDHTIRQLRELVLTTDLSYRLMGEQLGCSRNAVISKVERLAKKDEAVAQRLAALRAERGFVPRDRSPKRRYPRPTKGYTPPARPKSVVSKIVTRKPAMLIDPASKEVRMQALVEPAPADAVTIENLSTFGCRWVYGDTDVLWCNHRAMEGKSWCEKHYAIVFTKGH